MTDAERPEHLPELPEPRRTDLTPPAAQGPEAQRATSDEGSGSESSEPRQGMVLGGALGRTVQSSLSGESLSSRGVLDAIGGWRGVAETLVPGLLFLVTFTITRDARISALAPAAIAIIAIVIRLARRESIVSAFSGALGVGIAVGATLFTGQGEDYYLPGFITNIVWSAGLGISLLVGWPLLGFALGAFRGDLTGWRREKPLRRTAAWLTALWLALFVARLAVQVPLYLSAKNGGGDAATDALGMARLVMGLPLFALVVVFTWMVLNRLAPSSDDSEPGSQSPIGEKPASE